ncbi:MAG: hypothetical protein GKR89_30280 [Candidatus Latescibacteria bacterium]|nr:hypothetical protein [Candidatus Latescibacterota bacterium]
MAALPLLTLVEAARPIWWWGGLLRRALPAAYAAAAGLVGGLIYYEVQAEQLTMDAGLKTAEGTITVRLHQAPVMAGEAVVDAGGRLYPPCAPSGSQLGDLTGGDG